ncbi:hypothetical protein H072_1358 [Dactylellina haptotyla CBS 200.50]|uniref:FAS1 domain-containing protein n=1 Tax=Dactylellina haptotyla (strain CBS 200.50) TaxID=1284197 RepID=S8CAA3_DACHA|nr:hypothetical protein H072_1358 [Dactylellina haptotyla CBS 200.50]
MKCCLYSPALLAFFLSSFFFSSLAAAILPVTGWGSPDSPQEPFQDMASAHKSAAGPQDAPIVSDALSVQRDVSIFSDIVRGAASVYERLEDFGLNTTVLAPLNSAMRALPRKPWEDPNPDNNVQGAFAGLPGEKKAAENLERFVKAHMVPVSPFPENEKVQTLEGVTVWWTTENGITKIFPGGIEVKEVKGSVPNGQIWTLTGVINYAA